MFSRDKRQEHIAQIGESGIRNPTNELRIQVPKRLESSTWNPESTMWNPQSRTVLDSLTWGETYTWYYHERGICTEKTKSAQKLSFDIQWIPTKKKLLDRIADIRMIHEMSSAQNALDHLKDYCSNSWTTKPRVQCRLFNRVLKRWSAQWISIILFRWIVIYPVLSNPGGGYFLIRG